MHPASRPSRVLERRSGHGQVVRSEEHHRRAEDSRRPREATPGSQILAVMTALLVAIAPFQQKASAGVDEAIVGGMSGAMSSAATSALVCGGAAFSMAPATAAASPMAAPVIGMSTVAGLVTGAAHGYGTTTHESASNVGVLEGGAGGFVAALYLFVVTLWRR